MYFSTYCRNECAFCFYRADNDESPRYRKSLDEVVAICRDLAASGVVLLDLTMGEDPVIHDDPGYAGLLELVAAVCDGSGLPVMVSPGVVPDEVLAGLRAGGADWYALYQETHTPELYERLRAGQPFAARVAARRAARRAGLLVEDGMLTGIGDTAADRARSIAAMRDAAWEQVRVMTFVPQAGTPLADVQTGGDEAELLTIATMRLAMPDASDPRVSRRRRHPRSRAAPQRRRQRGDLDRAARPSASPACRRPSSTSTRVTARWPACCRTWRGWGCARARSPSTAPGLPRRTLRSEVPA